jgi:hypothetical protein
MLTAEEQSAGWRLLFDGKTTAGWRGFKSPTMPAGWQVRDGALTRVAQAGDIVTDAEFKDFELTLEWKVAPGGNSGIFYRVREATELKWVWETGPEMQVLDDARRRHPPAPATACTPRPAGSLAPRGNGTRCGSWSAGRESNTG